MTAHTHVTIMAGQTIPRKEPSVTHRKGRKRNILSIQASKGKAATSCIQANTAKHAVQCWIKLRGHIRSLSK